MNITLQTMTVGQTKKVHLKMYAADQAHNPSTTVDTTTPISTISVITGAGVASGAVDPGDNRAVVFTALAPGQCVIHVDKSPASPGGASPNYTINVQAAQVDNSRLDHLSEDPAV
jgi:hypothetical protein